MKYVGSLGFNISSSGATHTIFNKHFYRFLEPYNVGALNKYLPEFVWDLGTEQARLLLSSLILGDGTKKNDKWFGTLLHIIH
jgi:hypothetical protein